MKLICCDNYCHCSHRSLGLGRVTISFSEMMSLNNRSNLSGLFHFVSHLFAAAATLFRLRLLLLFARSLLALIAPRA